jgi:hypothetical protein
MISVVMAKMGIASDFFLPRDRIFDHCTGIDLCEIPHCFYASEDGFVTGSPFPTPKNHRSQTSIV